MMDNQQLAPQNVFENEVNETLVEQAYQDISKIYLQKISETYYAVGEYLLDVFFDNNIEWARSKTGKNYKSFLALELKVNPHDPERKLPSKSWLYNAINLVVDRYDLDGCEAYNQISISHKIELLPVKDIDKKKQLSELIIKYNLSVHKTRKSISSLKIRQNKGLLSLVTNPGLLYSEPYKEICSIKNLRKIDGESRIKTLNKAKKKMDVIQAELDERKNWMKNLKKLVKSIEKLEK